MELGAKNGIIFDQQTVVGARDLAAKGAVGGKNPTRDHRGLGNRSIERFKNGSVEVLPVDDTPGDIRRDHAGESGAVAGEALCLDLFLHRHRGGADLGGDVHALWTVEELRGRRRPGFAARGEGFVDVLANGGVELGAKNGIIFDQQTVVGARDLAAKGAVGGKHAARDHHGLGNRPIERLQDGSIEMLAGDGAGLQGAFGGLARHGGFERLA